MRRFEETYSNITKSIAQSRAHPPSPSSLVIGHVIRLSPLQATISISVVDGLALPPGEDVRYDRANIAYHDREVSLLVYRRYSCSRCASNREGQGQDRRLFSRRRRCSRSCGVSASCKQIPFSNKFKQISLGDARSYYVTTARNDLGVIFAESEAGET